MPRYQFRISKQQKLDTVLDLIFERTWGAIEPYFESKNLQLFDFNDFRSFVKMELVPYLCAYNLCGTSVECTDEIEGAPFIDREDTIYHLITPDTFSELVSRLSISAFHTIRHVVRPGQEGPLRSALEQSFRRELSQNLYYNPVCGRIDLCNESRAVDPFEER
jgi:hypothetical protein